MLFSRACAVPRLLALGILFASGVVTGLRNVVPFVGFLTVRSVSVYAAIVAFHLYGPGFDDATHGTVDAPEGPAVTPVW